MANYPNSSPSFTTKTNGQTIQPSHMNDVQDEIVAIGTELLTVGSWTPTFVAGGGVPTYSVQVGSYTKIGKRITFQGRLTITSFNTLSAGALTIAGLPFAAANVTNDYGGMSVHFYANITTAMTWMGGYIAPGASAITVQHTAGVTSNTVATNKTDLSAAADIIFSGTYHI